MTEKHTGHTSFTLTYTIYMYVHVSMYKTDVLGLTLSRQLLKDFEKSGWLKILNEDR